MIRAPAMLLAALVVGALATALAADTETRLEATVHGGFSQQLTSIRIEEGVATVRDRHRGADAFTEVRLVLEADEAAALREALAASRFFEDWSVAPPTLDAPTWSVDLSIDGRQRRRPQIPSSSQTEFQPLETFLWRLVHQARLATNLRHGSGRLAASRIRHAPRDHVLRWSALVPDVLAAATRAENARSAAEIARVLVRLSTPAKWEEDGARFLEALGSARGAAALTQWQQEIDEGGLDAFQTPQTKVALAAIEAWWAKGPTIDAPGRWDHDRVLTRLLLDGQPEAFAVAESITRAWSTLDAPVLPGGLPRLGLDAVRSTGRLLADAKREARAAGAILALELAKQATGRSARRKASAEERASIQARMTTDVVPLLERLAKDLHEPRVLREAGWEALDLLTGRDRSAERRAAERRAREAREERARPPPLEPVAGSLGIQGRVVAEGDVAVAGIRVVARRTDEALGYAYGVTGEDGTFALEGLAAGPHRVTVVRLRGRRFRPTVPALEDVPAGTAGVVLRLPGTILRGRLLDATGRPVPGRKVVARMRNAPSFFEAPYPTDGGMTETDDEGGFLLPFLLPGTYDLQVLGHDALRGAAGLEAGPTFRTIRMLEGSTIRGRVTDEEGRPLPGIRLSASPQDDGQLFLRVEQGPDGTFEVSGVEASRLYTIAAHLMGGAPPYRSASAVAIAGGRSDVHLRIPASPWVLVRLTTSPRTAYSIRLKRVAGGSPCELTFHGRRIRLAAAPGTWKVQARVRDVDAKGDPIYVWIDLGEVEGGDPERSFTVPP